MRIPAAVFLSFLVFFTPPALAEQKVDRGPFRVHYSAFSSDFLPPEVARRYNLPRSHSQGVVNINVQERGAENSFKGVPATVAVTATNLKGQVRRITVSEHHDGPSVYYLGTFPFTNAEELLFDVEVKPEGGGEPIAFNFRQQFFLP